MTLHRSRRPYSRAYATRQLASVRKQLAQVRAIDCGADWRKAASKRTALDSLEAKELKWIRVLAPEPIVVYSF